VSRPQGYSAAGMIIDDIIGNRTRDLPACNAVLQPAAPPLEKNIDVIKYF